MIFACADSVKAATPDVVKNQAAAAQTSTAATILYY
jgi:hypothetical protein